MLIAVAALDVRQFQIALLVWGVVGALTTRLAFAKGRNPTIWCFYALFLLPIALPHALIMKKDVAALRARESLEKGAPMRKSQAARGSRKDRRH